MSLKIKSNEIDLVFMGTSEFAAIILKNLLKNNYFIKAVYTQPDKLVGRDQEKKESAIKLVAQKEKIKIFQPSRFDKSTIEKLEKISPDLIIVADYGKILPPQVLKIPNFGCLNIHASLLPKFRGPSPIQNALWQGKRKTGVTIILMNEKIDAGDIISQKEISIKNNDTYLTLKQKLAETGSGLLLHTIPLWINQKIKPKPQDDSKVTLCQIIERKDGKIFFENSAKEIYNRYRALYPWPGIFAFWDNGKNMRRIKLVKISYNKKSSSQNYSLGEIFQDKKTKKIGIQTSQGVIYLEKIQMEGGTPLSINEFINGHSDFIGSILK